MRKGTLHVKLFKERIICTTHQKLSTILDRLRSEEEKDIVEYLLLLRRQEGMVTGWRE